MPVPTLACLLPSSSHPSARSNSILKFFTTKFRPPLPSTTPPSDAIAAAAAAAAAKERRDAALRERGLLPPLKHNKDLSRQEREHDSQLPVLQLVEDTAVIISSPTGVETVTAANLIKKEWEAKNCPVDERLNSFTFGGSWSPSNRSQTHHDTGSERKTSIQKISSPTDQQDDYSGSRHAVISGSAGRSHNSPEDDDELGQFSPTWVPLPSSPHPETGLAPASPTILPSTDPTAKYGSNETTLEQVITISTTPIVSLSPVAEKLEPKDNDVHRRKPSVSESQTSLATPSLDASSFSTGISLLGTAESSPRIKTTTLTGVKNIPMIVESPIEEGPLPEIFIPDVTLTLEAQQERYQDIQARRKKRKLFGQDPSMRLTVSASLTNMRRSVSNTLSRTKSNLNVKIPKQGGTFDASHLTSSPTYPFSNLAHVSGRRSLDVSATRLRQPVAPTLHSRASILMETSAIEDEEVRRMTEVAFLD